MLDSVCSLYSTHLYPQLINHLCQKVLVVVQQPPFAAALLVKSHVSSALHPVNNGMMNIVARLNVRIMHIQIPTAESQARLFISTIAGYSLLCAVTADHV